MSTINIIYQPQGRAAEYGKLAGNIFHGCGHGCRYCYAPGFLHCPHEEFWKNPYPRANILEHIAKNLENEDPALAGERVLLCFTCDPYQPIEEESHLTRAVIQLLHNFGHPVTILTKGGLRSRRDLDLLGPEDQYACTLFFSDEKYREKYEPRAAPTAERIEVLQEAHGRGIPTWVSCEPVIFPRQTLQLIREAAPYAGEIKIGKLNHNTPGTPGYIPEAEGIDLAMFGEEAVSLCKRLGVRYYIKNDLWRCMCASSN
ncbi:MAG: radical SAM protein [Methanoregulaceae archaeon]